MNNSLLKTANLVIKKTNLKDNKKLPTFFFFTDRKKFNDIFATIAELPLKSAVIIREYDLNYKQRLEFAKKVKLIADKKSLPVLIAKDLRLALKLKASGVHFTDFDKSWINYLRYKKNARKNFLFACCCHKLSTLKKADRLRMDIIFYSPVFKTTSHPNRRNLGVNKLASDSRKCKSNIYALGGINKHNIKLLKNCNISGIGGISLFKALGK